MNKDMDGEYELLTVRYEIADRTGYVMRNGCAWAPCTITPEVSRS